MYFEFVVVCFPLIPFSFSDIRKVRKKSLIPSKLKTGSL